MKKFLTLLTLVVVFVLAVSGLVACDDGGTQTTCKNGHTVETIPAVAATCTETGLTEGKQCSVCGTVLQQQTVVPTISHYYVDGYCTMCGAKEDICKGNHTEVTLPAVEATCTETGLTEGKKCSVCGTVLVEQEVIPALGHTEVTTAAVDPTCAKTGLTEGKKCSVCGEILVAQQTIAKIAHNYSDGTCTVCGAVDPDNIQDYVAQLTLDETSTTKKLKVTVKNFVDGDTTHFYADDATFSEGVLKARYLAINTPESTGTIEEWGKKASNFTKEKLSGAYEIMVESDDENWNADSTGSRYMVWVWYRTSADSAWRNLNLEILQNGLAIASNTANNRYGTICIKALNQAKAQKLYVFSGEKDPDMYYGSAKEITLRELRTNIEAYTGVDVAFEGIVISNSGSNGVYVQDYDAESGLYFGIYVYYGFKANGTLLSNLSIGNRVRVVGSCQYYETGGTYQVTDISYDILHPDDAGNTTLVSTGNEVVYTNVSAATWYSTVTLDVTTLDDNGDAVLDDNGGVVTTSQTFTYSDLVYDTAVTMTNLVVSSVYTTSNGGDSDGAMTLTCKVDGKTITVRTIVLYDSDGNLVTEEYFNGKTIDVKGVVESYNGSAQIKLLRLSDVTIEE